MTSEGLTGAMQRRLIPAVCAAAVAIGALLVPVTAWLFWPSVQRVGGGLASSHEAIVTDALEKGPQVPWAHLLISGAWALLLLSLAAVLLRVARARDRAEERLAATLAHIEQGVLFVGPDQRVELHNHRALELLDLPGEVMSRRPATPEILNLLKAQGEFAITSEELLNRILQPTLSQTPQGYEHLRPNGTVLEIRTTPLPDGGAVRTFADITERRKAIDDMNASMAFANSLINSSPDCIQLLDLAGNVTFISDLGQEMLEIEDFEAVRGRPFVEFFAAEQRNRVELALRRVRDGQTDRFTRMCPTLGGVAKWWEFIITPVHETGRVTERLFVVARDMSARQAHAEELSRAKEAAERASLAKSQFLASMSHEIRTPLNAILGFAALARDRQGHDRELRRQIELIEKAGDALLTIIDDVLDLAKIEAGKIELEERPLDLRGLAGDCLSLTRGLADQKGLAINCVVAPEIPCRVMADEARLRQILLNLLNNAVKFTPSGSVRLSIELGDTSDRMVLSVSDTGIGIASDRLPQLFQDFVQVDGSISRQYGGTGLGLSISRRLAELMGGTIGVSSSVGAGSTFHVTLPMVVSAREVAATAAAQPRDDTATTPRHILLVDDLSINLEIVGEMLASVGHRVELANNGPSAIAAYREGRHELILMDVQMPDMDGLETTRRIRELDAQGRAVPIIALTANVFSQQIESYRKAGMNDHLGKPFSRDGLLTLVERWTTAGLAAEGTASAAVPDSIADSAVPPLLDTSCLDELTRLIGLEKVLELLMRLRDDLSSRLRSAASDALQFDAHALVSSAGLLGFARLSAAARTLEQTIGRDGDVPVALTALVLIRTATLNELDAAIDRLENELGSGVPDDGAYAMTRLLPEGESAPQRPVMEPLQAH